MLPFPLHPHASLASTFGFLARSYFNLASAMVFGSTPSASSWETFQRAVQALSVIYAHHCDLIKKHRKFLNMISWAPLDPALDLARAIPCLINSGVLDNQGKKGPLPARIYVSNALMLAISKKNMEQVLAALIKAISVVMGVPDNLVHQCSLAMDKWEKIACHSYTNNARTPHWCQQDDRKYTWCLYPRSLFIDWIHLAYPLSMIHGEGSPRAHRKIGTLSQRCKLVLPPAHPPMHLHCICLPENNKFPADSSPKFQPLIMSLWSVYFLCNVKDQIRHISFAIKRSAKLLHWLQCQYNITKSSCQEIVTS